MNLTIAVDDKVLERARKVARRRGGAASVFVRQSPALEVHPLAVTGNLVSYERLASLLGVSVDQARCIVITCKRRC